MARSLQGSKGDFDGKPSCSRVKTGRGLPDTIGVSGLGVLSVCVFGTGLAVQWRLFLPDNTKYAFSALRTHVQGIEALLYSLPSAHMQVSCHC
jgi:hypothetical protein